MPYIAKNRRIAIDSGMDFPTTEGELNYRITKLVLEWIRKKGESYATYNSVLGVLECVKHELYRRRIAGYEDEKMKANGDVY